MKTEYTWSRLTQNYSMYKQWSIYKQSLVLLYTRATHGVFASYKYVFLFTVQPIR